MKKDMNFEEAMTSLENTVRKLESADMSLDESLKAFEEAIALVKVCNEKLDAAEHKVKILIAGEDGTVTDKPFTVKSDET